MEIENQKPVPMNLDAIEMSGDQKEWYVYRDDKHFGPFSVKWIQEFLEAGALSREHFIWRPGLQDWKSIEHFENFRAYLNDQSQQAMSDLDFENMLRVEDYRERELGSPTHPIRWGAQITEPLLESMSPTQIRIGWNRFHAAVQNGARTFGSWSIKSKLLAAVVGIAAIGALNLSLMDFQFTPQERAIYEAMNQKSQNLADQILDEGEAMAGVLPSLQPSEFVIVTNETMMSNKFEITLEGVTGTLVGIPNFRTRLEIENGTALHKFSNAGVSLDPLPPGQYFLKWKCLDCGEANPLVGESAVSQLFFVDKGLYRQKLKAYEGSYLAQAGLEKDELKQLHAALQQHFDFTIGEFSRINKFSGERRRNLWGLHTPEWQKDQGEFKKIFSSLADPQFLNQLVYRDIYQELGRVSEDIGRLQYLQSRVFQNESVNELSQASLLSDKLQKRLTKLRSEVMGLDRKSN
ncbi:MAG: DUF4339 domain-containing protein [Bdellovibrionales bacterium]|nr:DUF4339 domain-containing protein [Bdellovibrionales bacterium]